VIDLLVLTGTDEATHVTFLDGAVRSLGASPEGPLCQFDFTSALSSVTSAIDTARALELIGVNAYLGAVGLLASDVEGELNVNVLSQAGGILTVEGRHSSLLNSLAGGAFQASPFDTALTPAAVLALAGGFVKGGCDVVRATGITRMSSTLPSA